MDSLAQLYMLLSKSKESKEDTVFYDIFTNLTDYTKIAFIVQCYCKIATYSFYISMLLQICNLAFGTVNIPVIKDVPQMACDVIFINLDYIFLILSHNIHPNHYNVVLIEFSISMLLWQ